MSTDMTIRDDSPELYDDSNLQEEGAVFQLPDPDLFKDMPEFHSQLQRLYAELFSNNPELQEMMKKHGYRSIQQGKEVVMQVSVNKGGTLCLPNKEGAPQGNETGVTRDQYRTHTTLKNEGPADMLAFLESQINYYVGLMTGKNKGTSLKNILESKDYNNSNLFDMVDALRLLPTYKVLYDTLREIWDERAATTRRIDQLIDKRDSGTITPMEADEIRDDENNCREQAVVMALRKLGLEKQADALQAEVNKSLSFDS